MRIVWDIQARQSFRKYINHIKSDSLNSAEIVRKDILKMISELPNHPKRFPPDKFKKNNDGNFRAFEKHSCRIAYFVTQSQIRILRIRHVKQEPREY